MNLEHFKAVVPLLAVVLTALLTGYLVPRVTKNWQDYQRELDIKAALVEKTNIEVVSILLAMQLAERKAIAQADFDKAYQNWEIQRAVITSKLSLYFRDKTLATDFRNLSDAITDLYVLAGVQYPDYRSKQIGKLKQYFGEGTTDWELLESQDKRASDFFNWFFSWWKLREDTLIRKDKILSRLLAQAIQMDR